MRALTLWGALVLAGCGAGSDGEPASAAGDDSGASAESCTGTRTAVIVVAAMDFTVADDNGHVKGFDLDGIVSASGDAQGCGHADKTAPDGTPGIDAAFAGLAPTLESLGAGAVSDLVQGAIEGGDLLILAELTHLDQELAPGMSDDCVGFTLHRGKGVPLMGTDGIIMTDQSFARDDEFPSSATVTASISGGTLLAEGIDLSLPVQILDEFLVFNLRDASFTGSIGETRDLTGYFAGGVPQKEIADQIGAIDDIGGLQDVIPPIIASTADLYPDETGVCTELSMGFDFVGRPAFMVEDTAVADTGAAR
jgi:hypothetical protein